MEANFSKAVTSVTLVSDFTLSVLPGFILVPQTLLPSKVLLQGSFHTKANNGVLLESLRIANTGTGNSNPNFDNLTVLHMDGMAIIKEPDNSRQSYIYNATQSSTSTDVDLHRDGYSLVRGLTSRIPASTAQNDLVVDPSFRFPPRDPSRIQSYVTPTSPDTIGEHQCDGKAQGVFCKCTTTRSVR